MVNSWWCKVLLVRTWVIGGGRGCGMSTLLDHGYGSDNNVEWHVNGVRWRTDQWCALVRGLHETTSLSITQQHSVVPRPESYWAILVGGSTIEVRMSCFNRTCWLLHIEEKSNFIIYKTMIMPNHTTTEPIGQNMFNFSKRPSVQLIHGVMLTEPNIWAQDDICNR